MARGRWRGPDGFSDFDPLRAAVGTSRDGFLYAFDILELDGVDRVDLGRELWEERRKMLVRLLRKVKRGIELSEHVDAVDGPTLFRHACVVGLEGIVAKHRDRPYRSGRSQDWIKIKNPSAPATTRLIEA
jgi:bifunctional non-homologous end joining protein LigD